MKLQASLEPERLPAPGAAPGDQLYLARRMARLKESEAARALGLTVGELRSLEHHRAKLADSMDLQRAIMTLCRVA